MFITILGATQQLRSAVIEVLRRAFPEIPDIRLKLQWDGADWRVLEVRPLSSLPVAGATVGEIESALLASGLPVALA